MTTMERDMNHTVYLLGEAIFQGTRDACVDLYESDATALHAPGDTCSIRDADDMTVAKALVGSDGVHREVV